MIKLKRLGCALGIVMLGLLEHDLTEPIRWAFHRRGVM